MSTKKILFLNCEKAWIEGKPGSNIPSYLMLNFTFSGQANTVEKLKEILTIIDNHPDLSKQDLIEDFPTWFTSQFKPEKSEVEVENWIKKWRALNPQDRLKLQEESGWSFDEWIYWLRPENRVWHVIGDHQYSKTQYSCTLVADDWPAPAESFDWLIKASGGRNVDHD